SGDRRGQAAPCRGARRDRRAGALRQGVPRDPRAGQADPVALGAPCNGDGASLLTAARAGRGDAAARDGVVYRGSEEGGRGIALVISEPDDRGVRPGRATWIAVAAAGAVVGFLIVLM